VRGVHLKIPLEPYPHKKRQKRRATIASGADIDQTHCADIDKTSQASRLSLGKPASSFRIYRRRLLSAAKWHPMV
jgi:hypothetical protein